MNVRLDTPVTVLAGVGTARAKNLSKLGIGTVGDLLLHCPREHEDRRELYSISDAPAARPACVTAMAAETPRTARIRKGLELTRVRVVDGSASMVVTFFNQSYVRDAIRPGESYVFFGTVEGEGRTRTMTNPVFEQENRQKNTGCIMPVYPLTAGVSSNLLAGLVRQALPAADALTDCIPERVREEYDLVEMGDAVRDIHFPPDFERLDRARRRMIFEELFLLTVGLELLKCRRVQGIGPKFSCEDPERFEKRLPFAPTNAQRGAMEDIRRDMTSGTPMNRLVQGDVGSGKTAVAAFGAWLAAQNGWQTALMAPTEILAEQHYRSLSGLLAPAGVRVALLTAGVKGAARKKLLAAVAAGEYDLIIGTHALLSEGVGYAKLGLVIADEQHRFGVTQRAALAAKGGKGNLRPHVLVMSATPIPRTLALIIYGDLDVSVMDELPPGRIPVQTYLVGEDKRSRMYGFVRKLAAEGRQVYIICPAVEETDPESGETAAMDLKAVTRYAKELQEKVFPDLRIGLVHGKLKSKEKDAVMSAFAAGELDVLVATTVVEVGVDVANAALIIVENAERFGLSQLHQLRGRVGRGKWQSYCVLMSATRNEESRARLKVMTSAADGFAIAEEDLRLRGPGDFFGSRQHGLPTLRVADLAGNMLLLVQAQEAAKKLLREDPELARPEHADLLERVRRLFNENPDIFN